MTSGINPNPISKNNYPVNTGPYQYKSSGNIYLGKYSAAPPLENESKTAGLPESSESQRSFLNHLWQLAQKDPGFSGGKTEGLA